MQVVQRIWQENKKFLLLAGGGLAACLLLHSCGVQGLHSAAAAGHRRNEKEADAVLQLREEVFARYGEERKTREDLEAIEKDLQARFLTPPPREVPDSRSSPQIQFSDRIDRIWNDLRSKANQRNVRIPEKVTTADLRVSPEDGPEDHARNAAYLDLLARGLLAAVEAGATEIRRPVLHPEEEGPVRGNEGIFVVYRRVALPLQGPFGAFTRILRVLQDPPFVQARLVSLDARGAPGSASLNGVVEVVGVVFWKEGGGAEPSPEPATGDTGKKKKRKRSR